MEKLFILSLLLSGGCIFGAACEDDNDDGLVYLGSKYVKSSAHADTLNGALEQVRKGVQKSSDLTADQKTVYGAICESLHLDSRKHRASTLDQESDAFVKSLDLTEHERVDLFNLLQEMIAKIPKDYKMGVECYTSVVWERLYMLQDLLNGSITPETDHRFEAILAAVKSGKSLTCRL